MAGSSNQVPAAIASGIICLLLGVGLTIVISYAAGLYSPPPRESAIPPEVEEGLKAKGKGGMGGMMGGGKGGKGGTRGGMRGGKGQMPPDKEKGDQTDKGDKDNGEKTDKGGKSKDETPPGKDS